VTEDGTIVLNDALVRQLELTEPEIQQQAETTRAEVARRIAAFRVHLPETSVEGKTAIIIDDGLASGFTMVAAVKSMQRRKASQIVAAVPVASGPAYDLLKKMVNELVCLVVAGAFLGALLGVDLARSVAALFIAAMLAMIAALGLFLREVYLAVRTGTHTRP